MTEHVNVNGAWKEVDKQWVNVNGTWKEVDKKFVNVDGTWRESYSSGLATLTPGRGSAAGQEYFGYLKNVSGWSNFGSLIPDTIPTNKGNLFIQYLYYWPSFNFTYMGVGSPFSNSPITIDLAGVKATITPASGATGDIFQLRNRVNQSLSITSISIK